MYRLVAGATRFGRGVGAFAPRELPSVIVRHSRLPAGAALGDLLTLREGRFDGSIHHRRGFVQTELTFQPNVLGICPRRSQHVG